MGLSILGAAAFVVIPGIELPETGINCRGFSTRYFPEIDRPTKNIKDETVGSVVSTVPSREINIKGEVLSGAAAGVMLYTWIAGVAPANDTTDFGSAVGLIMLKDVTVDQTPGGNRSIDMNLRSDPLFTSVS